MKNIILASCLLISLSLHSQYYYNDIISTQEINRQMSSLIQNKIRAVTATGTDQRGIKATDISEYQEIRDNGKTLKVSSIAQLRKTVEYTRFDDKGRVSSVVDSSSDLQSLTNYRYDDAGRLVQVENTLIDPDSAKSFNQAELHYWYYRPNGKPEKMWRVIKNGDFLDSMEVRFVIDENGNVAEERTFKYNYETGYLYYYYDDKGRMTDIVRYNTKARRLLPDMMFEYDDNDRVIQKITTVSSMAMGGYLLWRYIYNDKGLKTKEALFNKEKQMTGRIDYSFTFQ